LRNNNPKISQWLHRTLTRFLFGDALKYYFAAQFTLPFFFFMIAFGLILGNTIAVSIKPLLFFIH
jgi:hypothetical protein